MRKAEWSKGVLVWLLPTLPTAPAAAYTQPRVVIVTPPSSATNGRVEVELPDGNRLWTNTANIHRVLPRPAQPKLPTSRTELPAGQEQPTLW